MISRSWLGVMIGALALPAVAASDTPPAVTFVQLTDVHLFDAENPQARIANEAALRWAVLEINRMAMPGQGTAVDFVVFTGGLGTEALAVEDLENAIAALSPILQVLVTDKILWVPGAHAGCKHAEIMFGDFADRLDKALPDKKLMFSWEEAFPLKGLRFIGLDSTTFGEAAEVSDGFRWLERLEGIAQEGEDPVFIFTHTTDLDSERDAVTGAPIPFWKPRDLRERWTDLARKPEIAAVFAGGVHSRERTVYGRSDGTLGGDRPLTVLAKTWVCPPLGSRRERYMEPGRRGFLTATVDRSRKVATDIVWLSSSESKMRDKSGRLTAGRLALESGRLAEAEKAFLEALESTDGGVARQAEEYLRTTRERMKGLRWRWVDGSPLVRYLRQYWIALAIGGLVVIVYAGVQIFRKSIKIVSPVALTDKAPAELWPAELLAAIEHTRQVLSQEKRYWYSGRQGSYSRPSSAVESIAASLPTLKGVDTGKIYKLLMTLERYLGWHLESEVAGTAEEAQVYVCLKRAWRTKKVWRVPMASERPLDLSAAARQVASNVVYEMS